MLKRHLLEGKLTLEAGASQTRTSSRQANGGTAALKTGMICARKAESDRI